MKLSVAITVAALCTEACVPAGRLRILKEEKISASISLPPAEEYQPAQKGKLKEISGRNLFEPDSLENTPERAGLDENGEVVAFDHIKPAVVTARFRNVAERGGKVFLCFDINVPKEMTGRDWMLEFTPLLLRAGDTLSLEAVRLTGEDYRKEQLRGYELYEKFLGSIITDSMDLRDRHQLEVFIKRNIPGLYSFRQDSSFVDESEFTSAFGVSQREAIRHYTLKHLVRRNDQRIARKGRMKAKYIKMPLGEKKLRIDSVLHSYDADIVLEYPQSIEARSGLRKVSIVLEGSLYSQDRVIYRMPQSRPLDFYISSLSTLAQPVERFVRRIVERRVRADDECRIDFAAGSSEVEPSRSGNARETERIKSALRELLRSDLFELDSIVVTASCSPEGSFSFNKRLSGRRAESVCKYFGSFLGEVTDSLREELPMEMGQDGRMRRAEGGLPSVRLLPRSIPENWALLEELVERDGSMPESGKKAFFKTASAAGPDAREKALSRHPFYTHIREKLYPQLRKVDFNLYMHRRGMIKDTVYTSEPDTVYARGLAALKDLDYKTAAALLLPYRDYNAAVACCAMEYNSTALEILRPLPRSGKVCYLSALLLSRLDRKEEAVEEYLEACSYEPTFINRGNLDPEISILKNHIK